MNWQNENSASSNFKPIVDGERWERGVEHEWWNHDSEPAGERLIDFPSGFYFHIFTMGPHSKEKIFLGIF